MASNDFPVGSIVYFLATKTEKVLPAQVVERIDRTSLSGIKSTYIIAVRASGDSIKKLEVDPEKIELFKSPDEMKNFMVQRATDAIGILVEQAVSASSIFETFEKPQVPSAVDNDLMDMESWHIPAAERPIGKKRGKKSKEKNPEKDEFVEVDLGDGKKAKMRLQQ